MEKFVIGVDSGGSKTRALAVALDGMPVGYAETAGGNPFHNPDYKAALSGAILGAAKDVCIENIGCVVSGIAGLNDTSDYQWAIDATTIEGLEADQLHVNDAEIAHFGAFSGSFGVVSIQGHGSNIYAVTEDGSKVLNSNFLHYASSGAVALGMKLHFAVLWGGCKSDESPLIDRLCEHWEVDSLDGLFALGRRGWGLKPESARNHMAAFAPQITSAASEGSELAMSACRQAAYSVAEGIALVGQCFQSPAVPVVLSGSTVRTEVISSLVASYLEQANGKTFPIKDADHSPLIGAALMALQHHGVEISHIKISTNFAGPRAG